MPAQSAPDLGGAVMERPIKGVLAASPTTMRHSSSRSPALRSPGLQGRPPLPDRKVTSATIENAYVDFILYCNPAVPLDADTTALRESFRTPPKSGGKSFSTFALFELIKQLEAKELKTWGELALKLGVEPPDEGKGQSSQKIQQYAVRLKRWMHSLHVDTFFKYLMDSPHPYWTEVPTELDPFADNGRDGVALEDDMALRALLPHIRPRRGRRRPEDEECSKSPSQRPKLESPAIPEEFHRPPEGFEPWSAHPDGRNTFVFHGADGLMANQRPGQAPGPPWTHPDVAQTPLTAYPQSAITPSTRNVFWGEEPRSAVTPSRPKSLGKRHGAKVVSSAWKSGGSGKTRGRPPIKRENHEGAYGQGQDGPFSAFPATNEMVNFKLPPLGSANPDMSLTTIPPPASLPQNVAVADMSLPPSSEAPPPGSRPSKPNRLSLQVPERVGGEVRLATPPPVLMVNGQETSTNGAGWFEEDSRGSTHTAAASDSEVPFTNTAGTQNMPNPLGTTPSDGTDPPLLEKVKFQDASDMTNLDGLQAYFVYEIVRADWFDAQGNPIPTCPVSEAYAITNQVIDHVRAKAQSREGFLIDMAALAGGKILMSTTKLKCTRLEELEDRTVYQCDWELRLRDIKGSYKMQETVPHSMWKRPVPESDRVSGSTTLGAAAGTTVTTGDDTMSAQHWQQKYQSLLDIVQKKERMLAEMTYSGLESLKAHESLKSYGQKGGT